MSNPTLESLEALKIFLSKSSKEEFKENLSLFSLSELVESLTLLRTQPVSEANEKLHELLSWIDASFNIELLGKHFSPKSFANYLEIMSQHPHFQNRLSHLLVGIDPLVFSEALQYLQDVHLDLLKQEGLQEPLQYQLTQFFHEGEALKEAIEREGLKFQQELNSYIPEQVSSDLLQELLTKIDGFRNILIEYLDKTSTALAIVWHTNRIDLIEKLSSINESIQHQLNHFVGHPAFDTLPPTGLYAYLQNHFAKVFDSSLRDNDAAIEGMTRLSIWHLKDYWELGLLPFLKEEEILDMEKQMDNESKRLEEQERYMILVKEQLEQLRIKTVADLKHLHLFSRSLLRTYIEENGRSRE